MLANKWYFDRRKMRRLLSILSVVIGLALASCGGPSPSTTLNVTMIDFAFEPREFAVPVGQQINLNTANNGVVVNNFVIMKFGTTTGNSWDDDDMPNIYIGRLSCSQAIPPASLSPPRRNPVNIRWFAGHQGILNQEWSPT